MSYLIPNDYLSWIQQTALLQAISNNPIYQALIEQVAQNAFVEALIAKYDLSQEFTDTNKYSPTAAYNARDRVYLDATLYSQSQASYAVGALTLFGGQVYICTTLIAAPQVFTPGNWRLLGNQFDIFYAITPYPIFDVSKGFYNVGNIVWWKNHTYTALQQSQVPTHAQKLQYYRTTNIPYPNVFPDDPVNGPNAWHDNGAYVIAAGNLNNTTFFIKGDNRNQSVLKHYVSLTLHDLYGRIPPKTIPDTIVSKYKAAMVWIESASRGNDFTPGLVAIQPPRGGRIRSGSLVKQQNSY